ncbi:MAG: hypothetical protein ACKVUS_12355 [Saprospiraceae bacterium]
MRALILVKERVVFKSSEKVRSPKILDAAKISFVRFPAKKTAAPQLLAGRRLSSKIKTRLY